MTRILRGFLLFCAASVFTGLNAAEVDQFTHASTPLDDSLSYVNDMSNRSLKKAVKKANQHSQSCREEVLYEEMQVYFDNHINGKIIIDLKHDETLSKITLAPKESIYRKWNVLDGLILGRPGAAKSELAMAPVMQMGENRIGLDKLEHIFAVGYDYFRKYYKDQMPIEEVLINGVWWEKLLYGGKKWGTGVFSYGDLAANFNGMRFWNAVLKKHQDLMGQDIGPYVTCQDDQWQLAEPIDLAAYIDASLNEGINCSKFASENTAKKAREQIDKLGVSCPLEPQKLEKVKEKYGYFGNFILNTDGLEASESTESWREQLGHESGWARVPQKFSGHLNFSVDDLYYRQESTYLRTFRLKNSYSPRRNRPRHRVITWDDVEISESAPQEIKKCWYIFVTGGKCGETPIRPLPYHYTEKGSLDLLSYIRDVSRINGMVQAKEVLKDKLLDLDASGGDLSQRVFETTLNKDKVFQGSFTQIPEEKRSSIGVYFTLGIGGEDSDNAILMQNAAKKVKELGFESEMLDVSPVLGSEHNAKLLNRMLKKRLPDLDKVIFVTASKGAADFITYFLNYGAELSQKDRKKVQLVVSLSGVMRSSFVAKYLSESYGLTALSVRNFLSLSGQRPMLKGIQSLAKNPWKGHDRGKIKELFPNMKWISFASIPEDETAVTRLSLWSGFLKNPVHEWAHLASPSDGLVETAASVLPPDTGIPQFVIPVYGPHAMALGSYKQDFLVAPQSQDQRGRNINPDSGPEILDAMFRALPGNLIKSE